jgi:hypothetical protein
MIRHAQQPSGVANQTVVSQVGGGAVALACSSQAMTSKRWPLAVCKGRFCQLMRTTMGSPRAKPGPRLLAKA